MTVEVQPKVKSVMHVHIIQHISDVSFMCKPSCSFSLTHLFIGAGFDQRIPGLQFALQHAVVSVLLIDLFPVRVHLHHQLGVSFLQAGARRVRALHLRLHLGQLVQHPAVLSGHAPVVKRQNDDNHQ